MSLKASDVEKEALESYCWMFSTRNIPRVSRDLSNLMVISLIIGVQRHLQWRWPGQEWHNHRLQFVLPGFKFSIFYPLAFFSVGSPLPDIQCPLVLLPATLLAEHGGRPHEVLRQGNHYKVITFISSKPKSKRFCLWEPVFPGVFFVFPGLLKIKRRRRRG